MAVEYSYNDYLTYCKRHDLPAHNILSEYEIDLAKKCSISMYRVSKRKERYEGNQMFQCALNDEYKRLDNNRVRHMFYAKFYAEIFAGLGGELADEWVREQTRI